MNKPVPTKAVATATATPIPKHSLVVAFATKFGIEPQKLLETLRDTAFKPVKNKDNGTYTPVTEAQMIALLVVAQEYGLNPFLKEIYAFPAKGGGVVPIIGIDGWIRIVNNHPAFRSVAFAYSEPSETLDDLWIECAMVRNDRDGAIVVREYWTECHQNTDPWKDMPHRMLRHKAYIQCARLAFGYGGIYDPDEGERIANAVAIDATAVPRGKPATAAPQAKQIEAPAAKDSNAKLADVQLELVKTINQSGVPDSEVLAHFEKGTLEEFTINECEQAIAWINETLHAGE